MKLIAILLLTAMPAYAHPGDVQDPDTGEWGQPEKPQRDLPQSNRDSRDPAIMCCWRGDTPVTRFERDRAACQQMVDARQVLPKCGRL